jgi:hypothetical protein
VNEVPFCFRSPPSAASFAPFSTVPVTVTASLIFTGLSGAFTVSAGGVLSTVNVRFTVALPRNGFGAVTSSSCLPSGRPARLTTPSRMSAGLPSTVALTFFASTPSGTTFTDAAFAPTTAPSDSPLSDRDPPVLARAVGTPTARAATTAIGTSTAGRRRRDTVREGLPGSSEW